jgi:UDP-glucose:(heptosyl)LPS alpha-1,3-glucosyltransferase
MKYTKRGGMERCIVNLSKELVDRNNEVHIFANKYNKEDKDPRIIFHKVPIIRAGNLLKILSFLYFSQRLLSKERFDLVYGFGNTIKQDVYRVSGCQKTWQYESLKIYRNPFLRLLKKIRRIIFPSYLLSSLIEYCQLNTNGNRRIITVSNQTKNELINQYKIDPKKIEVIYNGIDLEEFLIEKKDIMRKQIRNQYGLGEDEFIILFVANDFRRKGLEYLIRAIAELNQGKILVVGNGRRRYYKNMANKLGIKDRILFIGSIDKDLPLYYAGSDIFVFPTFYDPLANVCLEAMAMGLPIITTKSNGISEVLTEGKQGFIIDKPNDYKLIAQKINILFDKNLREQMSNEARKLAENYSLSNNVNKVLEVFKGTIRGKHKG